MTLEEIMDEWDKDGLIKKDDISNESLQVPKLHGKYLRYFANESIILKKYKIDFDKVYKFKWQYYTGNMTREELSEYDLQPFQLKVLKQDLPIYLNADTEIVNTKLKVELQEEKIKILESILKSIATRSFNIRDHIESIKIDNGLI